MAQVQYEVVGVPHYREGALYPVGSIITLNEPIPNEEAWLYLKRVGPKNAEEALRAQVEKEIRASLESEIAGQVEEAFKERLAALKKAEKKAEK